MMAEVELPGIPEELIAEIQATTFRECERCGRPIPVEVKSCWRCDEKAGEIRAKSRRPG